ncbi:MAG: hypothetical protein KGY45_03295 [Hadesarchaea archaeon]|nr:hypothetical protein [Hadesarchaea archaeon]
MKTRGYVNEFSEILEMLNSRTWTNDFDKTRVALAILSERAKDRRMDKINNKKEVEEKEPATEKQKNFMNKLGVNYSSGITKQKASKEIEKALSSEGH